MTSVRTDFLPVDFYRFLDEEIGIRSNSEEILAHLRSMYRRFYLGSDDEPSHRQMKWENIAWPGMQIMDDLAGSNELLIDDKRYFYQLSKVDGYSCFTCQDLHTSTERLSGFCDPLILIQSSLLTTIGLAAKNYHLVHAGVVAWRKKGIVFSATSGMGKTTSVLKLVERGCKFLSDEVACFDLARGILEPFPRKVNIRSESQELLGLRLGANTGEASGETSVSERMVDIEDIVPGALSHSCRPRFIIFLRGFGEKPRLERVSGSNAMFELLNSYIGPIENTAALLFEFTPTFNEAQCFNLVLGDPEETADLILQLVD